MINYNKYIINILIVLLFSTGLHAANENKERLDKLNILIKYDLEFNSGVSLDSIVAWDKLLAPELEEQKQYNLLFQIKMMAVQALVTQGNISLAINDANSMYQKAKDINYPLGIALSLRAMGAAYLSSTTPQAGIDSYKEALSMMLKIPDADIYTQSTLRRLIIMKLEAKSLKDFPTDTKLLETLYQKKPDVPTQFFLLCSNAYYNIEINKLPKALDYLRQMDVFYTEYPYPYYKVIIKFLYSRYHLQSKDYHLALKELDELLLGVNYSGSYKYSQMLQERAELLAHMGKSLEACQTYDSINKYKDSLDAQSYSRQINELHTLYQIDQSELANQVKQKQILYWSIFIILLILVLIVFFIIRFKRENKWLLKSQQEQEEAKVQAENSIRTKSLFLSNMSHEIRTPLNALSGFSAILTEESVDNDTRKQCNDIIQQNSELLLKLINDVIDLSSLELGKMKFKFNECDAVGLCRNVIDMVVKIKQTNADVLFETSLDSLQLVSDDARLQQVLINLLINATKFTTQGSIILKLEKQDEKTALFSVTDTGCGIPHEKQAKIFQRFEKLNESAQGTGLGLSICQIIIEQLGGDIWIDPTYEDGARFLFSHPIKSSQQGREASK